MAGKRPALPDATNAGFLLDALHAVNARRAEHGVPPLRMDPLLVEYAKTRAAALSGHDGGRPRPGTAEAVFSTEGDDMSDAADAVASWSGDRLGSAATTAMGAARAAGQGPAAYETYIVFVFEPPGP